MARNGAGQYDLPAGQPVVTGTVISSTVFNTFTADVAAALTQSLSKDGQTTPTANLPLGGFKLTGLGDGNARTNSASFGQIQDRTGATIGTVGGTGDAITGILTPTLTAYIAGAIYTVIAPGTNATTTPTIAINGLAAKTILRANGSAIVAGDIVSTRGLVLYYNGTNFLLLNAVNATSGLFSDGSAASPAVSFVADTDNGMYRIGTDNYGFSVGGTLRFSFTTAAIVTTLPITGQNGTVGAPAFTFASDPDTGIFRGGANTLSFAAGGTTVAFMGTTFFSTNTGIQFQNDDGTVGLPAVSFFNDADTGLYRIGANNVGLATAGILRFDVSASLITSSLPYLAPNGNAGVPTFTFTSDQDNGLYYITTNTWGLTSGGTLVAQVGPAQFSTVNGTVGAPAFAFTGDLDNGLYYIGTNDWGLSAAGALVLEILAGQAKYLTFEVGFRQIPQNIQAANYTCVLADDGKHIYHASGAGAGDTYTIPANGSVAYPIGTCLTFINNDSNSVSIAITTDTMTLAGTTTVGTRTLAQNGIATAIKTTATTWLISGPGVT